MDFTPLASKLCQPITSLTLVNRPRLRPSGQPRQRSKGAGVALLLASAVLLSSCGGAATPTVFQTASEATATRAAARPAIPEITPTTNAQLLPEHRIGVRVINGVGEFYDRLSGEEFVPRGYNYVHLAPMSPTNPSLWHSTLNPGFYDPAITEAALAHMQAGGYNTVRVFVDCCRAGNNVGDPAGGLSERYLANLVDFLERAAAHEIYTLLEMDLLPADGGYDELWRSCCDAFDGANLRYLTAGGYAAKRRSLQDIIGALIDRKARLDRVFAYGLTNEVFYEKNRAPLTRTSGSIRTVNGETYDLSDPAQRQRMMDENLVAWIDQMRAAILEVDPSALVDASFFEPQSPNPVRINDVRLVRTYPAIWDSTADFIDLHAYPGVALTLAQYVENYELNGMSEKPILMGEFGAFKGRFPTVQRAAEALLAWQIESCRYGFDGWLLWTYDAHNQAELWNAMSEGAVIHQTLAPVNRPDPCGP